MPVFRQRIVFANMAVREAMRRNLNRIPADASMAACIRHMIKLRANALLVEDDEGRPIGVISKTDLIGAYYAGLAVGNPLGDIMAGPPLFCYPDDRLEEVLDRMQRRGVHQVFVQGAEAGEVAGILAYSDIVGLLYRYCRACPQSSRQSGPDKDYELIRMTVSEVMTAAVTSCRDTDSISAVIEVISGQHLGAVLISDEHEKPVGTVSKTDLILAYVHGLAVTEAAAAVMSSPVVTAKSDALLADAIQKMLLRDVQRLFVRAAGTGKVIGVLSLSDAARFRSGTCRACTASRILDVT